MTAPGRVEIGRFRPKEEVRDVLLFCYGALLFFATPAAER